MIEEKDWEELRETGLLFFINQVLHAFGWAIVFKYTEEGDLKEVYPARTSSRGFNEKSVSEGYKKINKYMAENSKELLEEVKEE